MTAPRWITCSVCGEKRDASARWTSPANQKRDAEDWAREHAHEDQRPD